MREIKFRAKRKDTGQWYYFTLEDFQDSGLSEYYSDALDFGMFDKETVGQYTGLKDKNGTEIYEGDIIEGEIWNNLFRYYIKIRLVVKWDEAGYWTYEDKEHQFVGGYLSDVKDVKVIGNIYQNPELLKESE